MTETCAGIQGVLDRVRWYTVPGSQLPSGTSDVPDAVGAVFFEAQGARIVLADSFATNPQVVRHEMLHVLLGPTISGHPTAAFRTHCGGIVACVGQCATETGRDTLPLPGAQTVDVSALVVSANLVGVPVHLSAAGGVSGYHGGYYAMIARVQNPRRTSVWARLRKLPSHPAEAATFGVVFLDPGAGTGAELSGVFHYVLADSVPFGPGETKRLAFDELATSYTPRTAVTVRAFFNADTTAPALPLTIDP